MVGLDNFFVSARLNIIFSVIFFHVKFNGLRKLLFYSYYGAIQTFISKTLGLSESPIFSFFLIEMPSLNRNKRDPILEKGRD